MALIEPAKMSRIGPMKNRLQAAVRITLVIAAVVALPGASFAQVKVIISGGVSAAYRELLPEFEKANAITVTTTSGGSVGDGPNTIGGQIPRGVPAGVGILGRGRIR